MREQGGSEWVRSKKVKVKTIRKKEKPVNPHYS
jgi:hypothetical protein